MATYDVAAWRDVGTSIAIPHIARLQAIAASEVLSLGRCSKPTLDVR
jgi:hypothetical protein